MTDWRASNLWTRAMRDHINATARKAADEARKVEQQAADQRQAAQVGVR